MGCVISGLSSKDDTPSAAQEGKAHGEQRNNVTAKAQAQPQEVQCNDQLKPQLMPTPCGDICQVQSPWPGCGKPANEEQRLAATEKLQLIGKGPQPELQRYVDLVSVVYKRQLVLLSLFDADHAQIINTSAALPFKELSRQYTPCAWALVPNAPEVLMIEDLTKDARFRDFQVVANPPYVRSYVGTPIVLANGYRVGVLCALDLQPRAMDAASTRLMVNVAGLIAREIEGLAGADYDIPKQPKAGAGKQQGLMLLDTSCGGWTILHSNCDSRQLDAKQTEGRYLWDIFTVPDVAQPEVLFEATLAEGLAFKVKAGIADASGFARADDEQYELEFRPGDGSLPAQYVAMGTQVGTPAWVPDSADTDVDVAKNWFVIIKGIKTKRPRERDHVRVDTAGFNSALPTTSGRSLASLGVADVRGGWEDVQVGYLLGRGSSGSVYRATCDGQHVAVKIISPEQDKYIKRTPDGTPMEVALTKDLNHPNIVRTLRHASFTSQNASLTVMTEGSIWSMTSSDSLWGDTEDLPHQDHAAEGKPALETWLLLEFCDRGSLLDAVDRGWLLSEASHFSGVVGLKRLLLTALELATALAYLHGVDIMHGDLTGGNVMLHSAPVTADDPRGFTVKVADFGMSRIHSDTKQTASQGTITHMPPELIRKGVMHRSADVWAFGVLMWEMYSGQRAWIGMSYTQVMQAIGYEQRSPEWPADAPADLAAFGRACFDLDPDQRPTFKQAVQQLEDMLAQSRAANSPPGSDIPTQIREALNGASIPDVVTCTTQSVQHTEMDLTAAVQQTAAAASG